MSIRSIAEADFVHRLWRQSLLQSPQLSCTLDSLSHTLDHCGAIHIGFNDIDNEGTFVWTDGRSVRYEDWGPGQPLTSVLLMQIAPSG